MATALERQEIIDAFPKLGETQFEVTSNPTSSYNCIAWAAGRDDVWMWPGRFWPRDTPAAVTRLAFIKAFQERGYEECETGDFEPGFEKVCLYLKMNKPTHAARQLNDGRWSSKLGAEHDIAHELDGLIGNRYGKPKLFMRREIAG